MTEQPPPGDPYGVPPGGAAHGGAGPVAGRRPGTVTAAAVITIVFSVTTLIALAFGLIGLFAVRDDVLREIDDTAGTQDFDPDQLIVVVAVVLVVLILWAVAGVVLALLVLRRSALARILLIVSSVLTALLSLIAILSLISALTLIAAVTVVILLLVGGAGDWFADRPRGSGNPPPVALR